MEARKLGQVVRVDLDEDGRPLCNCCHERTVEIGPDVFQCALGADILARLAELVPALEKAADAQSFWTTTNAEDPAVVLAEVSAILARARTD